MLKGIGLLLIVSACSVTGASFSGRLKKRVTLLEKLLLFLELFMVELRFSMADTGELLRRVWQSGQVRELWFLEEILQEEGKGTPVPLLWESGCRAFLKRDPVAASLEPTDRELLLKLGGLLGNADCEGQIALLQRHQDLFEQHLTSAKERYAQLSRLYLSFGVLTGLGAAVLLL